MVKTAKCHQNVHIRTYPRTVTAAAQINTPATVTDRGSSLILQLDLA